MLAVDADGNLFAVRRELFFQQSQELCDMTSAHLPPGVAVELVAADIDTFLASRVFWIKMGLVVLLLGNGAIMRMAQQQAEDGSVRAWSRLRTTAGVSLLLWFLTILAGTALPNIG